MAVVRTPLVALVGTDETTGVSIASGSDSGAGVVQDLLGDNSSACRVIVYLVATCLATVGTLDVYLSQNRLNTTDYTPSSPQFQVTPTNGTFKKRLGALAPGRFLAGKVANNGTGVSATNVSLLTEVEKYS